MKAIYFTLIGLHCPFLVSGLGRATKVKTEPVSETDDARHVNIALCRVSKRRQKAGKAAQAVGVKRERDESPAGSRPTKKCLHIPGQAIYFGEYIGEGASRKLHGYGVMQYYNGNRYEGDWVQGKRQGQGTLTWENLQVEGKERYKGAWYNDKYHGRGKLKYAWRNYYDGVFVQGKRLHGMHTSNPWKKRNRTGPVTYHGNYEDEKFHGVGMLNKGKGGDMYHGHWHRGKYHGKGFFLCANGEMYVGDFDQGKYHGLGTKTYPDGKGTCHVFKSAVSKLLKSPKRFQYLGSDFNIIVSIIVVSISGAGKLF